MSIDRSLAWQRFCVVVTCCDMLWRVMGDIGRLANFGCGEMWRGVGACCGHDAPWSYQRTLGSYGILSLAQLKFAPGIILLFLGFSGSTLQIPCWQTAVSGSGCIFAFNELEKTRCLKNFEDVEVKWSQEILCTAWGFRSVPWNLRGLPRLRWWTEAFDARDLAVRSDHWRRKAGMPSIARLQRLSLHVCAPVVAKLWHQAKNRFRMRLV